MQIRRWSKNYEKIKELAEKSPNNLTIHPSTLVQNIYVEDEIYQWIILEHHEEMIVSTKDIVEKALSICPSFKVELYQKDDVGCTISCSVEICVSVYVRECPKMWKQLCKM